ncbi:MAG: PRC-barrel domain-containing protein [Armatimonadota bacterium]
MRELSSLIGLQVISTGEGKKLGSVADAYVDLAAGELVCVTLAKTPELRVILAGDIEVIGDDAIMVADHSKLRGREDVEEELARGKRVLSSPPSVVTSQGKTLGQLGAVQIDEGTKNVIRFEVTGGPLKDVTEGVLALPILEGIVHGEDTVIVPHEVVARRLVQSGGLRGALRNFGERLKIGVDEIGERSGEFVRESEQKLKEQAAEARKKAGDATEKAKKRMSEVAEDAKEGAEKARKKADEAADKAKHRVSEVAEDAKEGAREAREKADDVAEKAEEAVSEVAEDAEEVLDAKKSAKHPEAPDDEPDSPRMEDPEGEREDAVIPDEGKETHLVPEAATPLPEGAEEDEDQEVAEENAADEPSSNNEDEEEPDQDHA